VHALGTRTVEVLTSTGIRSEAVLKASTPCRAAGRSSFWYHLVASGLVKSTRPSPPATGQTADLTAGCLRRYPAAFAFGERRRCPCRVDPDADVYVLLVQTASMPRGPGRYAGPRKSHQLTRASRSSRKWKTDKGRSRSAIASMKLETSPRHYFAVKLVESHRPLGPGGHAGRHDPVSAGTAPDLFGCRRR